MIALISATWFLANIGLSSAADQQGTPDELSETLDGNLTMYLDVCWARVHNPHNSSSNNPGPQYIQAKTDVHCPDILSEVGTLTVWNSLFIWDTADNSWSLMNSNQSDCPAETAVGGWTQCLIANSGYHPVMTAGVNALCIKGSSEDYLQTSLGRLTKTDGSTHWGTAVKAAYNIGCKG